MKKTILKWTLIIGLTGGTIGGGYGIYMFNMPHRDVQGTNADFTLEAQTLVEEYLNNAAAANEKYLQEDGDSKVIIVYGRVASIDIDLKGQRVIQLKEVNGKAGISCTFMESTNANAEALRPGQLVKIKGVIRSGAGYDEDLDLYEDVILEKCDLVS
ncbi:MAG: hypothetical protein O2887_09380 [Bacteroidetes bacterium]|nr:hypothetical protein [Bacteroidota bacterium]